MARADQRIKVISQVRVGDQWVPVSELTEEQKDRLAIGLQVTYLNELYKGRVEFFPPPGFEIRREGGNIRVERVPIAAETA